MRVRRGLGCSLAAAIMLTSVATVGYAAPTAAEKETARGLVRSGRVKRRRGDLDAALEDFAAAHAIMNVPTTGLELGKAQLEAGLLVEALDTLLGVVRLPKARVEPAAFRRARKEAGELAKELPLDIPAVVIELTGDAAEGARVAIDGKEQRPELIGAPIKLNPGSHEIVASGPGGAEATETIELPKGTTREVTLRLEAPIAPDDQGTGTEDAAGATTNPGVWVGFGLAGAGVIVGSITGALAITKYGDVAPQCRDNLCPPEVHDDLDSGKTMGTVSTISFIVAGVGAAAGVVSLFFPLDSDDDADAEDEASAELGVGPGFVSLRGRF